jgi:hypothetical protein
LPASLRRRVDKEKKKKDVDEKQEDSQRPEPVLLVRRGEEPNREGSPSAAATAALAAAERKEGGDGAWLGESRPLCAISPSSLLPIVRANRRLSFIFHLGADARLGSRRPRPKPAENRPLPPPTRRRATRRSLLQRACLRDLLKRKRRRRREEEPKKDEDYDSDLLESSDYDDGDDDVDDADSGGVLVFEARRGPFRARVRRTLDRRYTNHRIGVKVYQVRFGVVRERGAELDAVDAGIFHLYGLLEEVSVLVKGDEKKGVRKRARDSERGRGARARAN